MYLSYRKYSYHSTNLQCVVSWNMLPTFINVNNNHYKGNNSTSRLYMGMYGET